MNQLCYTYIHLTLDSSARLSQIDYANEIFPSIKNKLSSNNFHSQRPYIIRERCLMTGKWKRLLQRYYYIMIFTLIRRILIHSAGERIKIYFVKTKIILFSKQIQSACRKHANNTINIMYYTIIVLCSFKSFVDSQCYKGQAVGSCLI